MTPRDREVNGLQDALARAVIRDMEHPDSSAAGQLIGDKIHQPGLADRIGTEHRGSYTNESIALLVRTSRPSSV